VAENVALVALDTLRARLSAQNTLRVYASGGHSWEAGFAFGPPGSADQIAHVEREVGLRLPEVYREVLLAYDGMVLFQDMEYFQWGYRLYSTTELLQGKSTVMGMRPPDWIPSFLACAECLGSSDRLVLDTARPTADGRDCVVLDAAGGELPSQWSPATRSFGQWVDHLIVAQGQKFWLWR
jgi:hypothetical protein